MPFFIVKDDITRIQVDAIVNPANTKLDRRGGISRTIYQSAGEDELKKACSQIGHCKAGKVVITEGFELSADYIIHMVAPVWRGGIFGEKRILYKAYLNALKLAKAHGIKSIAFPLLSSGNNAFPGDKAFKVAISAISDFLKKDEIFVYLVFRDRDSVTVSSKLIQAIDSYIDEHYAASDNMLYEQETADLHDGWGTIFLGDEQAKTTQGGSDDDTLFMLPGAEMLSSTGGPMQQSDAELKLPEFLKEKEPADALQPSIRLRNLEDIMAHMGETFSQMLLRLIDERGYTDAEVYRKANIDRRHFSKIKNNVDYVPNKKTVFAFAIALELSLDESVDLLKAAGFSFSDGSKFDVIVSFFLENGIYDMFEINEVLFFYKQPLIGG